MEHSENIKSSREVAKGSEEKAELSLSPELKCPGTNGKVNDDSFYELDKSGGIAGVEVFEDFLRFIGTAGPWNYMVLSLLSLGCTATVFDSMSYEFIGVTPDHWCQVEVLQEANWTQHQILDLAIPYRNGTGYETCQMYDYNYTLAVDLGYESAMEILATEIQRKENIIPCFSRAFNHTQYESTLVTEFDLVCERRPLYSTSQAVTQFGILIGCILVGFLNENYGRRPVTLWSVVLCLITGFGAAAANSLELYMIMKILRCAFGNIIYVSAFVILVEICSLKQRSMVSCLCLLPWTVGLMLVPGIAYLVRPWRWLQAAYTLPTLLYCLNFWFMPESPRWLISKGRYEEALKIFSWAADCNKKSLPPSKNLIISMKKITPMVDKEPKRKRLDKILNQIKEIFVLLIKPEFRLKVVVCGFCWFAVSFVYYGIALGSSTLSTDPYIFIFLGGLTEIVSYTMLWPSIAYLGRRNSLISQFLFCGLAISLITVLTITFNKVSDGLILFLSLSGKLTITATFHLAYIYTSELFPTKYRPLAIGQCSVLARVGSMTSPFIVDLFGAVIVWGPSVLFTAVSIFAACLALALPETKDNVMNEEKISKLENTENNNPSQDSKDFISDNSKTP